ncbi:MAG: hypothetical protein JKY81_13315 [Colwellia sp.]|nr:hypothetical protein [Colwellia sp.]
MNKQISDQGLASQVDKLPKEIQPQRDLWSGIERAIQGKNQQDASEVKHNNIIPMAWAASLIAAVLVTWIAFKPTSLQLSTPLLVSNEQASSTSDMALASSMQSSFQQQKQTMLVSYGAPDMTNLPISMQNQLTALAQARQTIKKALTNDSTNVDLLNLLRFTQQQELNLLQQLYPYMNNKNAQWQRI